MSEEVKNKRPATFVGLAGPTQRMQLVHARMPRKAGRGCLRQVTSGLEGAQCVRLLNVFGGGGGAQHVGTMSTARMLVMIVRRCHVTICPVASLACARSGRAG